MGGPTRILHMNFFIKKKVFATFLFIYRNVFAFGKSYRKLFRMKRIVLNSPLISRKILAQQFDTCSIIIKIYKSNIANQNNITNTEESSLFFENIIKTNT